MTDSLTLLARKSVAPFSPIDEIIAEARAGRMFIIVDAEGRENTGDLVVPAGAANADAINFMAMHGRGLVCLALTRERAEHLGLELMSRKNKPRRPSDFTVSIEARGGVSTGISAADRARTIAVAIDPNSTRDDISTPGHVFPLIARDGGVLVRAGRSEAAVDVSVLAGLSAAGVLCEIVSEDGAMARLSEITPLAERFGLKIATVADLIAYRLRRERIVERVDERLIESEFGGSWHLNVYRSELDRSEHAALVFGEPATGGPILVRVHALNILRDVIGAAGRDNDAVRKAMAQIAREGRGVVVLIRDSRGIWDQLTAAGSSPPDQALREVGIGAQILLDLGIKEMVLLSNSRQSFVALDGFGLKIAGWRSLS
jgi:3,4-dihydroxy 2-butanone 4-phosphate synthase/GTP cyclohydrolase II